MDVRRASGSRSTYDAGGVPCWSARGEPPGRAFDLPVRTPARCDHQQGDRSRDCDGSKKTGLGREPVLHAGCRLERYRGGSSIRETGLARRRVMPCPDHQREIRRSLFTVLQEFPWYFAHKPSWWQMPCHLGYTAS